MAIPLKKKGPRCSRGGLNRALVQHAGDARPTFRPNWPEHAPIHHAGGSRARRRVRATPQQLKGLESLRQHVQRLGCHSEDGRIYRLSLSVSL